MNRQIRGNKIVDLTPLLDVVLILLFALLMNMSMEQDNFKDEAKELEAKIEQSELEKIRLENDLVQRQEEIEQLENNMEILEEQNEEYSEAVLSWLVSEEVRDRELMTSDELSELFNETETNQSLYQLDFIANQFFFIEIEYDTGFLHEVLVNGEKTGVQLTFDKRLDQKQIEKAYEELFDYVEKVMVDKDGGYKFVLFTLTDDGHVYKYAYDLVWGVIKEIESKYSENTIYKLQYLDYN